MIKIAKVISVLLLACTVTNFSEPASINCLGVWQGYITASYQGESLLNSGYILHVQSQDNDLISGTAYIYRTETFAFEGVFDFIGTVSNNQLKVRELNILKEKLFDNDVSLCIKLMSMELTRKDGHDYLTGKWDDTFKNTKANTVCPVGNIYLKRYPEIDLEKSDSVPEGIIRTIQSSKSLKMTFRQTQLAQPILLNVSSPLIRFEIRDYLREDNDTVSIYLNRRPVIENLKIQKKPYWGVFKLNENSELNEIILYAENLGFTPPNTSNLSIFDGRKEYRLNIESSKETSAVIYLRYRPEKQTNKTSQ